MDPAAPPCTVSVADPDADVIVPELAEIIVPPVLVVVETLPLEADCIGPPGFMLESVLAAETSEPEEAAEVKEAMPGPVKRALE